MTNMTSGDRTRGRPREFDPETVLRKVVDVFWAQGFSGASISDLEDTTGVVRTSLYNHFGSKQSLLAAAISLYSAEVGESIARPLRDGTQGLDDVLETLEFITGMLTSGDHPPGCLVLSTIDEVVAMPELESLPAEYVAMMRDGINSALQRAAVLGEIEPETVDRRTRMLLAVLVGVNVMQRLVSTDDSTKETLDGLRAEVTAWRS